MEGELDSGSVGLMEKHMTFTPGSKGGALGSGLLNFAISRIQSFLTLIRLWVPQDMRVPLPAPWLSCLSW